MDLSLIARRFYQYRAWIGGVLAGFLIPVGVNLVSTLLEITWGPLPALGWTAGAAVAVWTAYMGLSRAGRFRPALIPEEKQAPRFPGLILLVGPGREGRDPLEGPNVPALEWHLRPVGKGRPLQVCWLVATGGPQGGIPVAELLRERFKDLCRVVIREIPNDLNPYHTYEVVRRIYEQEAEEHDLKPEEVVADFTGGHKVMSAGMIAACWDRWPLEYVSGGPGVKAESIPMLVQFEK